MRRPNTPNITGLRYGRLVATAFDGYKEESSGKRHAFWLFTCDCGNEVVLRANAVRRGATRSCGCLRSEAITEANLKHGKSIHGQKSKVYKAWCSIKQRCYNINSDHYNAYGGRGIRVCDEWRNSFETFYNDMGEPPSTSHSIERIDVNGNYCPENCCWATIAQQQNNTRRTIRIEFGEEVYSLKQLCTNLELDYSKVHQKLVKGYSTIDQLIPGAKLL